MNYPQTVTGVNIFVDGFGHLGTTKTVTLPKISRGEYESNTGGMVKAIDNGTLEKLEFDFTLKEYSPAIFAAIAAQGLLAATLIVKGNILQDGANKQALAIIRGHFKELDDGAWEAAKEVERKVTMSVDFYALEIDGKQALSIDADNLIYIIDGVDFMATVRQNLQ